MSSESAPEMLYEVRRTMTFLVAVAGFAYLIILETAPPNIRGMLLGFMIGLFIAVSVGAVIFVAQGGVVFGYASWYLIIPGVTFGSILFWLITTDARSVIITAVAALAILAMFGTAGIAVNFDRRFRSRE